MLITILIQNSKDYWAELPVHWFENFRLAENLLAIDSLKIVTKQIQK